VTKCQAASYGRTNCLCLLIDAGAQLTAVYDAGYLPLHLAAQEGHAECCSVLLAMGCDANARTTGLGETPLMVATGHKRMACVRVLLPESDLSVTNEQGNTVFHVMIALGNLEGFELLLPLISDVDVRTVPGVDANGSPSPVYNETPLHLACFFGQERMVKALLHRGASRTARDSMQRTPLHHASREGHLGCVRQLLGKPGAYKLTPNEVNAADVFGMTALHFAAKGGHTNLCGVLRAGGAQLDAVTRSGHTPLMVAQREHPSNTALIDFLAGRGPAHAPGTVCDECGRPEPEVRLSYCTGCLRARFCGNACLRAAWPGHKVDCQRIQAAREERSRPDITRV
jgi:cytohesin